MTNTASYYFERLEESYENMSCVVSKSSRLEFVSDSVFRFKTCDSAQSELFAKWGLAFCEIVQGRTGTPDPEAASEAYTWYLVMANMPFFRGRLKWGSSMRHAWWNSDQPDLLLLNSSYTFDGDSFRLFIEVLLEFSKRA